MNGDEMKIAEAKGKVKETAAQIKHLLEGFTNETGLYVEYVEIEQIHTEKGIVGYVVNLDVRLGR